MRDGLWRAETTVFTNSSTSAAVWVPKDHCIAILMRGYPPEIVECDDDHTYEMDFPVNKSGTWPIVVCVIPSKHKIAWAILSRDAVERMLDRVDRGVARRLRGEPVNNGDMIH